MPSSGVVDVHGDEGMPLQAPIKSLVPTLVVIDAVEEKEFTPSLLSLATKPSQNYSVC